MRLTWAGARVSVMRAAVIGISLAVLASGCSFLGAGGSGGASGSGPITVAVVPGIENAPLDVALQDGLFQQHGLNVSVKSYTSLSDAYQALTGGQAQIAAGDYTDFFYEQASGHTSLRLIADGYDAAPNSVAILALPGSKITTPQQLVGVTGSLGGVATAPVQLGLPATAAVPYSIQTLAAQEVLQNDGVSPSSVKWYQMPPQDMIAALRNGQVAAILATEPYIIEAEQQLGAVEVLDASTGVTSGLPMSGYFSLNSYAHANPAAVQAFQAALAQAQADCTQRGPVQAVMSHLTGMTTEGSALVTLGTYPTSLNIGQVQRVATLMYDSQMISNQISVGRLTSG
jgi:NitT/TauT family transport system substrate-binding protein